MSLLRTSKINVFEKVIRRWLSEADIEVNGIKPWDIHVSNSGFYRRVLAEGSLGLGESYMEQWWDCNQLDEFFFRLLRAGLESKPWININTVLALGEAKVLNIQSVKRAGKDVSKHYDLGNNLFKMMLDRHLIYSCGYWRKAKTLNEAQEHKLDLICRKLYLEPGMKVLDIGCGWGSLAKYAAENYGVEVTGITLSKEQLAEAKKRCANLPVKLRLQDYRTLHEQFDRIVSVGMFEHVGPKNYPAYFKVVNRCLRKGGIFLLHTIGCNTSTSTNDAWLNKYIFPGSLIPSLQQISRAIEGIFIMEDMHCFGPDYDKTLMAWYTNFIRNWDLLKEEYDRTFFRMWSYYLLCCAGSFRARKNQVWQFVMRKPGITGDYLSVR